MDITELRGTVLKRFQGLTDTEQTIVETMGDHPIGEIILKVIGPELAEIFSEPEGETDKMLADEESMNDEPDLARDMPEEFKEPMDETAVAISTEVNMPMEEPVEPVA